ncbi:MAG TPA: TIGR04141 family sporadically distributed protein [Arachnia sp.]|nr:TIGR04141 family sporadically distributed protein [Arachnia sp.]HMT84804.1 TIGR04141 family sporadically distributed protein [Arachnia sp.]
MAQVGYEEDADKERFERIDHLAEVKDPSSITALDKLLVGQLRAGDTTRTHLAMPENFGWDEILDFKLGGRGGTSSMISTSTST